MREAGLDEEWVGLIWTHAVMPYLEEQFFGDAGALGQFDLEVLKKSCLAAGVKGDAAALSDAAEDVEPNYGEEAAEGD